MSSPRNLALFNTNSETKRATGRGQCVARRDCQPKCSLLNTGAGGVTHLRSAVLVPDSCQLPVVN
jgi:hypothetical protein